MEVFKFEQFIKELFIYGQRSYNWATTYKEYCEGIAVWDD